jgi:hypothetical protein
MPNLEETRALFRERREPAEAPAEQEPNPVDSSSSDSAYPQEAKPPFTPEQIEECYRLTDDIMRRTGLGFDDAVEDAMISLSPTRGAFKPGAIEQERFRAMRVAVWHYRHELLQDRSRTRRFTKRWMSQVV